MSGLKLRPFFMDHSTTRPSVLMDTRVSPRSTPLFTHCTCCCGGCGGDVIVKKKSIYCCVLIMKYLIKAIDGTIARHTSWGMIDLRGELFTCQTGSVCLPGDVLLSATATEKC